MGPTWGLKKFSIGCPYFAIERSYNFIWIYDSSLKIGKGVCIGPAAPHANSGLELSSSGATGWVLYLCTFCLATPRVQVPGQVSAVMGAPGLWCG